MAIIDIIGALVVVAILGFGIYYIATNIRFKEKGE